MESGKPNDRTIDVNALKALSHPLRMQLLNALSQFGPQTASALASRLGESSGSTSYHLRQLAKHELVREVEGRGSARERWWERPPGDNDDCARTCAPPVPPGCPAELKGGRLRRIQVRCIKVY